MHHPLLHSPIVPDLIDPNKILDSIVIQEEVIVIKGMVVEEGEGRRK